MGHKTHPYGFRLGIIKDWKAHWYAGNARSYRELVLEDLRLRDSIKNEPGFPGLKSTVVPKTT